MCTAINALRFGQVDLPNGNESPFGTCMWWTCDLASSVVHLSAYLNLKVGKLDDRVVAQSDFDFFAV